MSRLAFLLFIPGLFLFAQNPPDAPMNLERPGMEPMWIEILEDLGLEGDIAKKVENMWYEHQKEVLDLRYEIEKAELDLRQYVSSDKFSVDKVMEKWRKVQSLRNKLAEKRMLFRINVFKLLPEEKQKEVGYWLLGMRRHHRGHLSHPRGEMPMHKGPGHHIMGR